MFNLFMIGIAPFSWRLGCTRRAPHKVVLAFGPFRLALHKVQS